MIGFSICLESKMLQSSKFFMLRSLLVLAFVVTVTSLDNGLGLTPRLAYSTWNYFGTEATETDVHNTVIYI